ncbi:hypothetical protein C8F04DRAFT_1400567 [Mycena alexandri]|uniref:Uncharacterized protein n=1 Tax=Mycena alexandri TaxID=1745969 RepID=A0AAD6SD96_9AGAR|nr:hypothetical protein C8F04DRAFT_1400567 [Mycena alexandri]
MSVRATLVHGACPFAACLNELSSTPFNFWYSDVENMPKNVSAQHSSISMARSYNGPCSPPFKYEFQLGVGLPRQSRVPRTGVETQVRDYCLEYPRILIFCRT